VDRFGTRVNKIGGAGTPISDLQPEADAIETSGALHKEMSQG
jgi:hypothetical protein